MKKTILIISIIIILVVCLSATIFACSNTVNADAYSSKIIEFNQLIRTINSSSYVKYANATTSSYGQNSITINNNGMTTSGNYYYGVQGQNNISYVSGHIYYISADITCTYSGNINLELWQSYNILSNVSTVANETTKVRQIKTCNNTVSRRDVWYIGNSTTNNTGSTTYANVMLIDLTQCFGSGSEPQTVEEVESLFPSEYYLYTTGSLMMYYPNATAESVAQTQKIEFEINSGNLYKNDSYQTRITMDTSTGYTQIYTNIGIDEGYQREAGGKFDFNFNIPSGSKVTIEINNIINNGHYATYFLYGPGTDYYTNFSDSLDSSTTAYNYYKQFYTQRDYNTLEISLIGTGNINQVSLQWQTFKITVEYVSNLSEVLDQVYDNGKKYMQQYYEQGNPGYTKIFNEGVASVNTGDQIFPDSWNLLSSAFTAVGDMLSIELFPNIPLGLFVALPLLLGLIAFIVKITKGGN